MPINRAKLQEIAASIAGAVEAQGLGRFDRDRIPNVPIPASIDARRFQMAVSPDCSYRLIAAAIHAAQHTLLVYIYEISAPYLLDLLRDAAGRGVEIRLMYDAGGTRRDDQEVLNELGFEVRPAPSSGGRSVFTVCHQKFVVADNQTVVVESANWAKTSIPLIQAGDPFKKGNREWLLRCDDEQVAAFFTTLFDADWNIKDLAAPEGLGRLDREVPEGILVASELAAAPHEVFDVQAFSQTVKLTPVISPINYFDQVSGLLEEAQQTIDLQQQYVLAGDGVNDLLDVVERKHQAGIAVRIIVSSAFPKNWNATVDTLRAAGLVDCLKAINLKYFTHCHNKGVIVDRKAVVVSSTNWSANSINKAREAGLLIRSPEMAGYYADVFDEDWSEGIPADSVAERFVELSGGELI